MIKAKPGDFVVVTNSSLSGLFEKAFVVIEPQCDPDLVDRIPDFIWITIGDSYTWLSHDEYKIVEKADLSLSTSCSDCNGTGQIELFTSVFECDCRKYIHETSSPMSGHYCHCGNEMTVGDHEAIGVCFTCYRG